MVTMKPLRWPHLLLGPLLAGGAWLLPLDLNSEAHLLLGIMVWVVVWWVLEVVPLAVAGIFGVVLAVLLGLSNLKPALAPFAHPLIFLFMGGFLLARAMSVQGLDRRTALFMLTRPGISGRPWSTIVMLVLVSGLLSMWISNTATTAMMLPIALGVLEVILPGDGPRRGLVLLALAYVSSMGGLATPVGSTPNIIALGMLDQYLGLRIDFLQWFAFALPLSLLCFGVLLVYLRLRLGPLPAAFDNSGMRAEFRDLGPMRRGERWALLALCVAVVGWVLPSLTGLSLGAAHPVAVWLDSRLQEPTVALLAACLLFLLPGEDGRATLSWADAIQIDWNSLLLFGSGLSLGQMLFATGLAESGGELLQAGLGSEPALWQVIVPVTFFTIFFTETTSNTATANMLIPLMIALASDQGLNPVLPVVAVAFAASLAFMMPVSTPPNAIVYSAGLVELRTMLRFGFWLNLLCGALVVGMVLGLDALGGLG